ncbi:MFS general substrate transporter [Peniophora sp. CONT]|nr:MFS general substrate transporter [Peniophora sp. CONT]
MASLNDAPEEKQPPRYSGRGTREEPYMVVWDLHDAENPYEWRTVRKAAITAVLAFGTWSVSFASSAYTGGIEPMRDALGASETVALLGVSLYVLGFGTGPLVWASMSEAFGRRRVFLATAFIHVFMHLGGALGKNMTAVLVTRFLAGAFGASPLTNAGGAIADMFTPAERGIASTIYSTAPYLGPVIGPIVGGFISETNVGVIPGWRFTFWLMFIIAALNWTLGFLFYAPTLLQRRARKLHKQSGGQLHYISVYDRTRNRSLKHVLYVNLTRPFRFLATEPIVIFTAVFMSLTYATLYAQFAAYPIVFSQHRGFGPGATGLAFLGIGVGVIIGVAAAPIQNAMYRRAMKKSASGHAPPEARLYASMAGGIFFAVGQFWFAWTADPLIHWIVPVLGSVPVGIGLALILQSLTQYMMDAYALYFASALASAVVLRSLLACAFPLIAPPMFHKLGDAWAVSIFAFLAAACAPVPFAFYMHGKRLREKSKFAWKELEDVRSESTIVAEKS